MWALCMHPTQGAMERVIKYIDDVDGVIRYFSRTDQYSYTDNQQRLEACTSRKGEGLLQTLSKTSIMTLLVWGRWSQALKDHPDKELRDYMSQV